MPSRAMLEQHKKLTAVDAWRQAMICKSCIMDEGCQEEERNSSSHIVTCFDADYAGGEGSMIITGMLSFNVPFLLRNKVLYLT